MDPKFVEMAKNELREEDSRKEQALQQFNDWLDKHPFITNARRDENFLLIFLRLTKFNVDQACQRYEKFYILPRKFPNYYDHSLEDLDRCLELFDTGFFYPLPGRDEEGRKVVYMRATRRDDSFTVAQIVKCVRYAFCVMLEDPETQIGGFSVIFDNSDVQLKHLFTPMDIKIMFEGIKTSISVRQKKYMVINTSSVVAKIMEVCGMIISDKMKERIALLKDVSELAEHVKPISVLPKELGGDQPESQIIADFKKLMIEKKDIFVRTITADVDWTKVPKQKLEDDEYENIGSFRKLEID